MQHFTDAHGRFEFPEHLFPEVRDPKPVPPSIGIRRSAIMRSASSALALLNRASHPQGSAPTPDERISAREWAQSVLEFTTIWAPLAPQIVDQANEILRMLAKQYNDAEAAYTLGSFMANNANERRAYLRQALKAGLNRAWYRVGVNSDARGDTASALSRFQRGADRSDSACLYTLGLAYLQGQLGLQKDVERGINLIELALPGADPDFPRAPYLIGKIMLGEGSPAGNSNNGSNNNSNNSGGGGGGGLGLDASVDRLVPPNQMRGLELVERSAVLGFAPALLRMAEAYLNPAERGFDCTIALRFLSLAACQDLYRRFNQRPPALGGMPEAQIVKWLLCGYENVMKKDEKWAFKFAEVSALDRNSSALFALAYFYEVGIATSPNAEQALNLYKLSSELGFPAASARLQQLTSGGKPQLRRTLTRQDHDEKLRKHRTALMRGEAGAASAAITDESTLVEEPKVPTVPKEVSPLGDAGRGDTGRVDVPLNCDNETPLNHSTAGSSPAQPIQVLPYPVSPPSRPALPYPEDSPVPSPWQSPQSSPVASPCISRSPSPRNSGELPYPRSPSPPSSRGRTGSAKQGPALQPVPSLKSLQDAPPLQPENTHTHIPPNEKPRRRPLSAQWMRQSIAGTRFFSTSQASLVSSQSQETSPVPSAMGSTSSLSQTSTTNDDLHSLRRRSQSPLRKIFGSTPEQRAAAARADRRSFTEAALAELANVPKVPVQPIQREKQPGVAYTFEEMGVKPVTSDKNDRCVLQ